MRKLIVAAALLAVAFYVVWPAWSAYRIYQGIQASDKTVIESKVDWAGVKASLKPVVDAEVGKALDRSAEDGVMGQVLAGPLRAEVVPRLSQVALDALVTPENIVRLAAEGGSLRGVLDNVIKSGLPGAAGPDGGIQIGGIKLPGGLGGIIGKALGRGEAGKPAAQGDGADKPATPASASPQNKGPAYGIANIKRFAITGPGSFEIGVAKNAAAPDADVTARMGFTGLDWKLVGLVPRMQK